MKEELQKSVAVESYFKLHDYEHRDLFLGLTYIWEALDKIGLYFSKYKNLGKHKGYVSPQAYLVNPEAIYIAEGARIEPSAYVEGPCIIGKNTIVRHGAYIRGNVITGEGCVIGHATEVKNSIFLDRSQAAHFAYVGDSVLGNRVNLGAGTRCANLKLAGDNVTIRLAGEKVSTGRRKLGAIIGDGAQLGCNSVTNPGTLMGRNSGCYPCINIGGLVKENEIVKR
jgi:UDP-N-acetylglucosamine diphosphorylase / glucose-1-phosphate thymidylyltransferase / UDP-N-acetylgalactosamine diphosphorylase / glucosamine-1-phosphate N-acetyltransferase / galactosamine-1-phosphate N-acetyltransferase